MSKWILAFAALWLIPQAAQAEPQPLSPRQIYKAYAPSVVLVFASDGGSRGSAGTGSIISTDGEVLTNAHVVAKDRRPMKSLFVYLKPERLRGNNAADLKRRFRATLVDVDHELDLALLKIVDPPDGILPIEFADPDVVEIGEPVVAIGHPETGGLWTLTTGSVSSVVSDFGGVPGKDVFQTEASVNRGNSGGPLLNAFGHMVGVNTSISRKSSDGLAITDINFSLKASVAKRWLEKRRLMEVAYAEPGQVAPAALVAAGVTSGPQIATVEGGGAGGGAAKVRPASDEPEIIRGTVQKGVTDDGKTAYRVETDDGKTLVVVVEPSDADRVQDDPQFALAASRSAEIVAAKQSKSSRPKKKPKIPPVKSKQLTRERPYQMDEFVKERLEEIRELEDLMDDARDRIDAKTGEKTQQKTKGLGLW